MCITAFVSCVYIEVALSKLATDVSEQPIRSIMVG